MECGDLSPLSSSANKDYNSGDRSPHSTIQPAAVAALLSMRACRQAFPVMRVPLLIAPDFTEQTDD
jgi:hypothetical protein